MSMEKVGPTLKFSWDFYKQFFWTPCVIYYIIYYLQGVLVPLVAVPGLLGNILSIAILRSNNIDMKVIDQPWHHHQHLSASTYAVSA